MNGAPSSSGVTDWTNHAHVAGGLTRNNGKTAVVRLVGSMLFDDGAGDLDPASARQIVDCGRFRVPAMDDGHPDPVHVAHLLRVQFGITQRIAHITAAWGERAVATAVLPAAVNGETDPLVTLWNLSPTQVQHNLKAIRDGGAL